MSFGNSISLIVIRAADDTLHPTLRHCMTTLPFADTQTVTGASRASALNDGSRSATGDFLWFVHADCALTATHCQALAQSLTLHPDALHYFLLRFDDDDYRLRCNAWAANWRSRCGFPYGDQGLCCHRDVFARIGGYPLQPVGEDLAFVYAAHRARVPLRQVASPPLLTSARKYHRYGWWRVTRQHLWYFSTQTFRFYCRR